MDGGEILNAQTGASQSSGLAPLADDRISEFELTVEHHLADLIVHAQFYCTVELRDETHDTELRAEERFSIQHARKDKTRAKTIFTGRRILLNENSLAVAPFQVGSVL